MRIVIAILCIIMLSNCGVQRRTTTENCSIQELDSGTQITCGSEVTVIPHPEDGEDGKDGQDAVLLNKTLLLSNACSEIYPDVYVQNINGGELFDVYSTSDCLDSSGGEYCDNVKTSFGNDSVGGDGASSVCWVPGIVGDVQLSGVKRSNGDIMIYILEFQ